MEKNEEIIAINDKTPTTQDIEIESLRAAQNALDNAYKENKRWFFAVLALICVIGWLGFAYFFADYDYGVIAQNQQSSYDSSQNVQTGGTN